MRPHPQHEPSQRIDVAVPFHQRTMFDRYTTARAKVELMWVLLQIGRQVADDLDTLDRARLAAAIGEGWKRSAGKAAQAEAIARRPELFPILDTALSTAVELRVSEPDLATLAGPLPPELERSFRLAGRPIGVLDRGFTDTVAATMPTSLVQAGRRAAWRISQADRDILTHIRDTQGPAAYRRALRTLEARGGVYTWPEIVREAADRHFLTAIAPTAATWRQLFAGNTSLDPGIPGYGTDPRALPPGRRSS